MKPRQLSFDSVLMPGEFLSSAEADQFNVGMLTLAREALGYTQNQLARLMGSNQARVSKIESGVLIPGKKDLEKIVAALKQKREFFFQLGAASAASPSFYRKFQSMPLRAFRQCNAQMNICRLEIEDKVGQAKLGNRELPCLPPEKMGGPKVVARAVRQKWAIEKGPVHHLTRLIEDSGCVIVDYNFPSTKLDGLCLRAPQKPPIIFLNQSFSKSRRRLSLAHELGHLVMHTEPHEKVEDEAWEFAEEFLMPAAEIIEDLDNLDFDKLGHLKRFWGVSMQALLRHAQKIGKISENNSRYLWVQIGKSGFRSNEPFEDSICDEKPREVDERLRTFT